MVDMFGYIGITVSVAVLLVVNFHHVLLANPFQMGRLEYFQIKEDKEKKKKTYGYQWQQNPQTPLPLVDLLENPNEENASAYLKWATVRNERIKEVQDLLKKVQTNNIQ